MLIKIRKWFVNLDEEDIEAVLKLNWREIKLGYLVTSIPNGSRWGRKCCTLGRYIVELHKPNLTSNLIVIHKDGNYFNAKKENLLITTRSYLKRNIVIKSQNYFDVIRGLPKGIYIRNGKYTSSVKRFGKTYYIGTFEDFNDAEKEMMKFKEETIKIYKSLLEG
jgi:hypothetical protein